MERRYLYWNGAYFHIKRTFSNISSFMLNGKHCSAMSCSMKLRCHCIGDILFTGRSRSCQNYTLWCRQWRQWRRARLNIGSLMVCYRSICPMSDIIITLPLWELCNSTNVTQATMMDMCKKFNESIQNAWYIQIKVSRTFMACNCFCEGQFHQLWTKEPFLQQDIPVACGNILSFLMDE